MGGDSFCDAADFGWEGVGSSLTLGLEQQEPISITYKVGARSPFLCQRFLDHYS